MAVSNTTDISFFYSEKLSGHVEIDHFFSSKQTGFNNLTEVASLIEVDSSRFVVPKQTHTDTIATITSENYKQIFYDTDALITNEKGLVLVAKTADCVPILLYNPATKAIAAVHSGWRGTSKNIVGKTIAKMELEYGSKAEDIIAAIGPCIGIKNYEVGPEVAEAFYNLLPMAEKAIKSTDGQKFKLDLKEANFQLLLKAGVKPENIDISKHCTYNSPTHFFSARRDGAKTGRMINGIVLR